jgi:hypothetical protein
VFDKLAMAQLQARLTTAGVTSEYHVLTGGAEPNDGFVPVSRTLVFIVHSFSRGKQQKPIYNVFLE